MIDVIVTAMMLFSGLALAFALLFCWLSKRAEARLRKTQQEYLIARHRLLHAAEVEENRRFWRTIVEAQAEDRQCGTK